jgi:hypothetical protein
VFSCLNYEEKVKTDKGAGGANLCLTFLFTFLIFHRQREENSQGQNSQQDLGAGF